MVTRASTNKASPRVYYSKIQSTSHASGSSPVGNPLSCLLRVVIILPALFAIILIGAEVQDIQAAKRPNTESYYTGEIVCAAVEGDSQLSVFESEDKAHASSGRVAHCGDCGSCSTRGDIAIYEKTKNTLTATATSCALKVFTGGKAAVRACFKDVVKLTGKCNKCWTDNVMCDLINCMFTCTKSLILGQSNNKGGTLNPCLFCDEHMCGPQFIECAGANRRRCGIVSDIGRDEAVEVCKRVDADWMVVLGP